MLEDRYAVLSSIGAGAAANVFRVRDLRTGAVRAAKVLKTEHAANADTLARFEDEYRILRSLHHPHLPEVYDYGWSADGGRFLGMELVDGEPLDHYFRAHPEDIWVILYELCETLVFVHGRNLLHQDIKPSNILVARSAAAGGSRPAIKLIDFGLTFRRGSGASVKLVGTPEYIAPEVVRGEKTLTRAVDYYSLGATLFELLTGAPPFTGSESEVLRAHLERQPVIEDEELEWAELYPHVRALLSKDAPARLVAFEEFRRAVVGRLTGGIEDLDRSYALARIDSLGMIGKQSAFDELMQWLGRVAGSDDGAQAHTVSVTGGEGVGKRYLLSALRSEASMRGIRTLTPADIDTVRSEGAVARQPALMWSRLLEMCEKEPVILVVARPSTLPDEERSFVRLAGTQWELMRSRGRVLPLYFLVAADSTTEDADVLDYLPSDAPIKIDLAAMTREERDQIVSQFRGSMFDSRDARALATYLERFEDVGGAVQGLQQAVLRSGLTFVGQRWKVQPSLLSEIATSRTNESYSRDLVSSLSPVERAIATLVAAHPRPVSFTWAAEFAGVERAEIHSIIEGSLKRLCMVSSEELLPASGAVRLALRVGSDADSIRRAHAFLVERLVGRERFTPHAHVLVYHYEQLGAVRDAARIHLRLLQAYWSTRPRERPYELIEGVCRSGLELLANHGTTVTPGTRRHLFCFYLKQWINALWARNLFTHAKPIIDEWTTRLNETMPASVAPRYVRSVLDTDGPRMALDVIDSWSRYAISTQLCSRLDLERSLCLHNQGHYALAMNALDGIRNRDRLGSQDSYRYQIYKAMNSEEMVGSNGDAISAILIDEARSHGCIDEAVLLRALKARALFAAGSPRRALHEIALGMRISLKHGLHIRSNLLNRLAASAYLDMDRIDRAKTCQERALRLAGTAGIRYLVMTSWSRLSNNERLAGRYGNALRCSTQALEFLGRDSPERDRNQAHLSLYAVNVLLRIADRTSASREAARGAALAKAPNDQGNYLMWRGRELMQDGKLENAEVTFTEARDLFLVAGYPLNAAWAALWQARVYVALLRRKEFFTTIAWVSTILKSKENGFTQLDYRVVKLKGSYVFRANARSLLLLARESDAMGSAEIDVSLRAELFAILFRVYSRYGLVDDALRAFDSYADLVRRVAANIDSESAKAIAKEFSLEELLQERRLLRVPREDAGDRIRSPVGASSL